MKARYKDLGHSMFTEISADVVRSTAAIFIWILYRRGWHKDALVKLFNEMVDVYSNPLTIFGKEIDDVHVRCLMEEKLGINFEKITVRVADAKESRKRSKDYEKIKSNRFSQKTITMR